MDKHGRRPVAPGPVLDPVTAIVIPLLVSSPVRMGGDVDATTVCPAASVIVNVPSRWTKSWPVISMSHRNARTSA